MTVSIRPGTIADEDDLSHICLLTANFGTSAVDIVSFPKLPGHIYVEPYLRLKSTYSFVLVDTDVIQNSSYSAPLAHDERIVGYIVGAADTREFERDAKDIWWPKLCAQYGHLREPAASVDLKSGELQYINRLFGPRIAADATIAFAPAHMHINILPEYQGKGYGRQLVGAAVRYLGSLDEGDGVDERRIKGLWLHINPQNTKAAAFYARLGFGPFEDAPEEMIGLRFEDWGQG
ncbi:acyl-CoA N-acyltransferase [Hygrophoropsis aurantiaca]|uniref:Acyl-CoA N-acyltransferase n=1 Tax=Hygrophoropsis aurantiaca TaxID=72124 RepID=A0ACB8AS12_9AGAM|nr:acyl-CoA N-acyltransferase [Hygrophoropsis aurantiaca]